MKYTVTFTMSQVALILAALADYRVHLYEYFDNFSEGTGWKAFYRKSIEVAEETVEILESAKPISPGPQDVVYMVQGSTGEYSDHHSWVVGYFEVEAEAHEWTERANEIARVILEEAEQKDWDLDPEHPMDDAFDLDYTGTFYMVYEINKIDW